ncbi:rhomboid family intramembrane serine protease [Flavihumibacter profundi]|jgi:membrane associated rhomboid family serine protease|uniref:rhomboid family intramembrane serine protease n=1 Tax=Flavihumibacter profundi TaxID=2716883 RepID=UPI001CC50164|nr:rhomboid family intramembrane serine protease [Flavihumibacter profundi]MBZ5858796.1 rhomboid family intramembrane serine protease [Flavihumibacter profundi]
MRSLPPVVKNLLIANVLVFLAQMYFRNSETPLELYGALWPIASGNFKIWQLVTHMFMHATNNWFHILFNMFTLYMFGSMLEQVWGPKRFFNFYIICGIVAALAQLFMGSDFGYAVGASGAIMGVLAAFTYLFPNTPLYLMFIPIPIKAKYAIPGLMALDLFGGIASVNGDNIAHWAHLGGAITGFILVVLWNKTNRNTFY